jgi:hypothetical protein
MGIVLEDCSKIQHFQMVVAQSRSLQLVRCFCLLSHVRSSIFWNASSERIRPTVAFSQEVSFVRQGGSGIPRRTTVAPALCHSCTPSAGNASMAPRTRLDYIVANEVVHLVHPNHTEAFRGTLDRILPDYHDRKECLRQKGAGLAI